MFDEDTGFTIDSGDIKEAGMSIGRYAAHETGQGTFVINGTSA